ncbi:MAG TPA: trypsin-like peptidase domain-containing protein [Acidobacteriaceae bacterium]|nr:trypsin-like peptidase domain-containing protein [Acidobacteriaceae bacterium]
MSQETNLLRAKAKRFAVPTLAVGAALFTGALVMGHNHVNAAIAPDNPITPINNSSIDPLLALDHATEAVASRVTPAVVNIAVTSRRSEQPAMEEQGQGGNDQDNPFSQFFGPGFGQQFGQGMPGGRSQRQIEHGIGSGVIISPNGYIVTNNHVVEGAVEVRVTLHDRRSFPAKVIGTDKLTDLAVVKIDATDLPTIAWGDSTKLVPGQSVLAIGNPFGQFQFSVTRGIVSAVDRSNPFRDDARKPGDFIQTDAAINPGNSGGPLVDARGELVGINTFLISDTGNFSGAGFAIPTQTVHPVVEALIKNGVVHHGYLGVGLNDVTPENAQFFNLPGNTGALIASVTPDSPASRAGLKEGDVVTGVNGRTVENGGDLQVVVSEIAPGSKIQLDVVRNGHPEKVDVTVGEYHKNQEVAASTSEQPGHARLGIAISDLTPDVRQQLNLPTDVKGVAIAQVQPGSPAEDAGLSSGDVIQEVDRKPVTSAEQFRSDVQGAPAGKDMLLLVWANGGSSYRIVHPEAASGNSGM